MIEGLKPLYNNALRPVAHLLVRVGIHPNVVTVGGMLLYVPVAWLLVRGQWKWAVALGFAGAILDGVDGVMAREFGKATRFGAFLDSVCDRFSEIIVFGALQIYYVRVEGELLSTASLLCFGAVTGSLMVSYVKARAEGAGIECRGGILQRPERLLFIGFFLIIGEKMLLWGLAVVALLSYFTVIERIIRVAWSGKKDDSETSSQKKQPAIH